MEAPIPTGTPVTLDADAVFYDRNLLAGGSPWRLLHLSISSRAVALRWRDGDVVRPGEERLARTLVRQGLLHPRYSSMPRIDGVDVVIPVHDDVASLRELLARFAPFHVTIVDDGSRDPLPLDMCATEFGVELVRLDKNCGPAEARNAGARSTDRGLLWFVDVDVVIDNATDVFERLAAHFDDPLVAAVAPRIRGGEGPTARDRFERRFGPLDMGGRSALVMPGSSVGYVPSACLLVRRSAFGDGFDPSLQVGEDVDLVWRLHDQGWLIRYVSDVVVTHRARDSWGGWWYQRVRYGASSGELALRHGARLAPLRTDGWTLVAWCSVFLKSPWAGARIWRIMRNVLRDRLVASSDDAQHVADSIVRRVAVRGGGGLTRSVVRTYGPLILVAALHPKLRRRALALFAIGTAWRWRQDRTHFVDVPLAVADDAAYAVGVWKGAWATRSWRAVTPHIEKSSIGYRDVLGLVRRSN